MKKTLSIVVAAVCCSLMAVSCAQQAETKKSELTTIGNPYLPLWEHIPDGEPYVFDDPDNPGKKRVQSARTGAYGTGCTRFIFEQSPSK